MRIVIYNEYLTTRGGGEKSTLDYAIYLANRFRSANIEIIGRLLPQWSAVDYFAYFDLKLPRATTFVDINTRLKGLSKVLTRIKIFKPFIVQRMLKQNYSAYDIFVNHTAASLIGPVARRNIYVLMFPFLGNSGQKVKDMIGRFWASRMILKYDRIFSISDFTRKLAVRVYGAPEKFQTVYPCFAKFTGSRNIQKNLRILNIARFDNSGHRKRQDLLLRAFASISQKIPSAELVLMGSLDEKDPGDREYFESLRTYIQAHRLSVKLLPNAPSSRKEKVLRNCNVFWLGTGFFDETPTRDIEKEHFGIVVLEAMSQGLVPFTYHDGGVIELFSDGQSGYKCADINELIEKTQVYWNLPQRKRLHLQRATQKRVEHFGWQAFKLRLDQLLPPSLFSPEQAP